MNKAALVPRLEKIIGNPAFGEATVDELRVLVTVIALGGRAVSYDELAEGAGVSVSRVKSALALFLDAGILAEPGEFADVSDEFKEPKYVERAENTAKDIRDMGLAGLIEDCAGVLGVTSLNMEWVKLITSLCKDEGLAFEYVLDLVAYLVSKLKKDQKLSPHKLEKEAEKLIEKGIDTREELEIYLSEKENERKDEWEYRRALGLRGKLSENERDYIDKWAHRYGFSSTIVELAYNVMRDNCIDGGSYQYLDKVLTVWYEAECKTIEDCKRESERVLGDFNKKSFGEGAKTKSGKPRVAQTPKYSDFNSDDALMKALERSYGKDKN